MSKQQSYFSIALIVFAVVLTVLAVVVIFTTPVF